MHDAATIYINEMMTAAVTHFTRPFNLQTTICGAGLRELLLRLNFLKEFLTFKDLVSLKTFKFNYLRDFLLEFIDFLYNI